MHVDDPVNVLLVDDQPAKLLSYEVILQELGENLLMASSGREALEHLLKHDVAVILVDVSMPELDGFQLAAMVREHPRYQKTPIIFVSAIHLADVDALRGYEMGAVDYVPVPVIPEVLRAKVRVFAELYRKSRQLERLNRELERRVSERTAELETSTASLVQSEQLRSLALAAGEMGSWHWDAASNECIWDDGQQRIFGVDAGFDPTVQSVRALLHPEDLRRLERAVETIARTGDPYHTEFRIRRADGEERWCSGTAVGQFNSAGRLVRLSGVTVDVTARKEAEARQALLTREVDHRARNALAVVQSIVRLTRADSTEAYVAAIDGRIGALARTHVLLSKARWEGAELAGLIEEEMAPYEAAVGERISTSGGKVVLQPGTAQVLALVVHELATNSAKYGALSRDAGKVALAWDQSPEALVLTWTERGGPAARTPSVRGFGTRVIKAMIERQLGGTVEFDWRAEGLHFRMTLPRLDAPGARNGVTLASPEGGRFTSGPVVLSGNRILVVEDESLVAMMMEHTLVESGFRVVGPIHRLADAVVAATEREVDAALLDVNLGGELVYPLADLLAGRGVPFAFLTGYAAEAIHPRFNGVPILQKPLARHALEKAFVLPPGLKRSPDAGSANVLSP
jgi:two-component sensor histidine kinase/DNA-binding response OmpR family regulator